MTATEEATDVEQIAHLDYPVPCVRQSCERAADWWVVCRMCEDSWTRCAPHLEGEKAFFAGHSSTPVVCLRCGARDSFEGLYDFVPVR